MEIPEKVSINFYISKELGQKVTSKGNPIISTGRGEVGQVDTSLHDFMVCDPIALNKKARKFQEKDKEQGGNVFLLSAKLVRTEDKAANDSHYATHKNEKAEELKKEIEKRTDCSRLKLVCKREELDNMA